MEADFKAKQQLAKLAKCRTHVEDSIYPDINGRKMNCFYLVCYHCINR
jgi:hypothetical protein